MIIINLTQHTPTPTQIAAGVFESGHAVEIRNLLTFNSIPSAQDIADRAMSLACLAEVVLSEKTDGPFFAMIGGAPWLMSALEKELSTCSITALYSFSERKSAEHTNADGTVTKTNIFEHVGFINLT